MGFEDFDVYETLSMYRRRYLLALAMVAALAISAFIANYSVIHTQSEDGVRINIAGRQRMLSQRMALFSMMRGQQASPERHQKTTGELREMRALFGRSHHALIHGDTKLGLAPQFPDARLDELYFGDAALDQRIQEFLTEIDALTALSMGSSPSAAQIDRIQRDASTLLPLLDQATKRYERQSTAHVDRLFVLELSIMVLMLLVLALEVVLIFRPMDRTLHEQLETIRQDGIDLELMTRRMQILLDSTGDGVVTLTPQGEFGEMHNGQFESWFGEVRRGEDALDVIFEEQELRDRMRMLFTVHSRTLNMVTLATSMPDLLDARGRKFTLRAHHAMMPEPRLVLIVQDMTSEHRVIDAHDTLVARQQLFSSMLLAMRYPLCAVEDQASQIKDEAEQPGVAQHAMNILVLVKQLLRSIDEPVQLSDMRGGNLVFRPSVFVLEELVTEVIQAIASAAELQHNTLQTMIEPGLSTVYTDRTKLFHLFVNILTRFNTLIDHGVLRVVVRTQHKNQQKSLLCELACRNKKTYSEPKIARKSDVVWQKVFERGADEIHELSPETILTRKLCEAIGAELFERSDEAEGLCYRFVVPINQSAENFSTDRIKTSA